MLCSKRRQLLTALPALSLWGALSNMPAMAVGRELPTSKSLQNDIAAALKTSKPLVVLVSLDHCPFCKIARENYLLPLMREQDLAVVQVNMGDVTTIFDPQGRRTTQSELIKSWQIAAAPTILFLGKNGQEIAPRMVGGSTSDFYGAYLQERIEQSIKALK